MKSGTNVLVALVLGAAAGVAVGYFLGSEKRDEWIGQIGECTDKLKNRIKDSVRKGKDHVGDLINDLDDMTQVAKQELSK